MKKQWHQIRPHALRELRNDIEETYPSLHVRVDGNDGVHVEGVFPVLDADGAVIDRFEVRLSLPPDYPRGLPAVRETGGRIPWSLGRHINEDGTACVMMPEERYRIWPVGEPLSQFLDGPIRNFFLGQLARDHGDPWPFGEWSHGDRGLYEYAQKEIGSTDPTVVGRFLCLVKDEQVSYNNTCPCGSDLKTKNCCRSKVVRLRQIFTPESAHRALTWTPITPKVTKLQQAAGTSMKLTS